MDDSVRLVHRDAFTMYPQFRHLPADLTGRNVKINFLLAPDSPAELRGEFMWVAVTKDDGLNLVGTLANDPVVVDLQYGDTIAFCEDEILAVEGNELSDWEWQSLVEYYFRRQHKHQQGYPEPYAVNTPNRRLSGWENTYKGRHFVLRNVDRELWRVPEKTVKRIWERE
jgi:Uncharacterized protein conserved in bacteria (DUF2314)